MLATSPSSPGRWLFLHGTPLTPRIWDGVRATLPTGTDSTAPLLTAPAGVTSVQAAAATSVVEELRRAGPGPVHVVGHSFGGQVALDVALMAPDLVASLTVICSRATPFPAFGQMAADLRQSGWVDVDGTVQRWFTAVEIAAAGPVVGYARRCLQTADREEWARCLAAIAEYDRSRQLSRLDLPVTLLAAELDPVSDPATMAAMADQIAGARLHVMAGAAHLSPFVDPAALSALIPLPARSH